MSAPAAYGVMGRDLVAELADWLLEHPGAPTEVVAAAVRARPATVRQLLAEDPRFAQVPPAGGRKANARCWAVAGIDGDGRGTGRDGQTSGPALRWLSAAASRRRRPLRRCAHEGRYSWSGPTGEALCGLCVPPSVSAAVASAAGRSV